MCSLIVCKTIVDKVQTMKRVDPCTELRKLTIRKSFLKTSETVTPIVCTKIVKLTNAISA